MGRTSDSGHTAPTVSILRHCGCSHFFPFSFFWINEKWFCNYLWRSAESLAEEKERNTYAGLFGLLSRTVAVSPAFSLSLSFPPFSSFTLLSFSLSLCESLCPFPTELRTERHEQKPETVPSRVKRALSDNQNL